MVLNKSTNDLFRLFIQVEAETPVTKIRYRVISFPSKRIISLVGLNLKGTFLGLKVNSKLHYNYKAPFGSNSPSTRVNVP